jgi:pSer/pThr/pTyr-binding forkhead associated (FHA) protein
MKLSLLVLTSGKQEGKTIEVKLPQFLVGRDPQCHLRPASPLISKRHCALIQRDGKAFVRDFGSTNGTFVNDERVEGERELNNGDELKIGPIQLTIRLEAAAAKPAGTKTPAPPTKPATQHTPTPPTKGAAATPAAKPVAPAKNATPAPATKKPAEASAEDDIAAMLLGLDDGDGSSAGQGGDGVPEGSTVFDLKVPPEVSGDGQVPPPGQGQAPAAPAKPKGSGDTRSAAASLLEQMTRRSRNPNS